MPPSQMALQRTGTFPMQKGRSLKSRQSATSVAVCGMLPQNEEMKMKMAFYAYVHACMHSSWSLIQSQAHPCCVDSIQGMPLKQDCSACCLRGLRGKAVPALPG